MVSILSIPEKRCLEKRGCSARSAKEKSDLMMITVQCSRRRRYGWRQNVEGVKSLQNLTD